MPEISLIEAQPRPLAVVRVTTQIAQWPKQFKVSLDKVYAALKTGRFRQTEHNIMVYRDRGDGLVDIECGIEIDRKFDPIGEVVYSETPSGTAITAAHIGPYHKLGVTHDAIGGWARSNGHQLTGINWEIYGDWDPDESKLRTDIFHLVRR